ncbi:MAG: Lpg1974 family pore-forming outer membrane protein [Chlamydiae bacterium]|nr:Lpg1974 family pore-forming outer membrane protein [Chlamydiota bacterium]
MINKNWAFALGMISLSTALVAADQAPDMDQKQPPMPMGVTSQPTGVITPPVAPRVSNGADFFVSADFIYWYAQQDGLSYAFSGELGSPANPSPSHSYQEQVNRKWEPGFKLGAGMEFEHDGWDLFAEWTWLNPITDNESSVENDSDDLYSYTLPVSGGGLPGLVTAESLDKAEGSWSLHYNVIDLELGRNFFLSRNLTLRPHIGLKTAWINQKFHKEYSATDLDFTGPNNTITLTGEIENKQSQESWGMGIRFGLDPVWHISRNWGIYGNVALSALYQYYSTTEKVSVAGSSSLFLLDDPIDFTFRHTKKSNHTLTPVLELGLGLEYMTWFYDEAYMLELKAGWEEQVWFNTNQFQSATAQGNLALQGFTMKAGFHF